MFHPRRLSPLAAALFLLILGPVSARAADGGWVDRKLPWYSLPRRELVGTAPVTLMSPVKAWDYGAASAGLEPFGARGPVFLKLTVKVESGTVGVSMMKNDGTALVSKEKVMTPKDGEQTLYFQVGPGDPPRMFVLRNPGQEGQSATVDVESFQVARDGQLSADQMARVNLGLL